MASAVSTSEKHGLNLLSESILRIYSVGISTGGAAEMKMAEMNPRCHVTATSLDEQGLSFARGQIAQNQLKGRVDAKLEDVSKRLPYDDNYFDYVYARLVLHYLPKDKLVEAFSELYRVLKPGANIFIVVRSDRCDHAHMPDSTYDPATELTEYTETDPIRGVIRLKRHFFSENSLAAYVEQANFKVRNVISYDERLFMDFKREVRDTRIDNLVELVAAK